MEYKKTYKFQSEVKELLQLMIHSLYSNKEIFLRELISNASDAIDKLRFKTISEPNLYKIDEKYKIRILINKKKKIIKIQDNGIGMTNEEIINNLGTIAKSGTKNFLKSLKIEKNKNSKFIGKFGVGFYSSFIVSKKVKVRTKSANLSNNQGILWTSDGKGEYDVQETKKINHGTEITLYLRENQEEFLDEERIKSIINKYSNYIEIPIEIQNKKKEKNEKYWEKINQSTALWTKNKTEITKKEYKEFYKNLFYDSIDPLCWTHNKVEGKQEYISLIYIPNKAPFDLWNQNNKNGLKIYVNRIFIMDDVKKFVPNYLRFIRGIIDSKDLPLNISREILQNNNSFNILKNSITKNILKLLEKLSENEPEKYQKFWKEFGLVFKEGVAEDQNNKELIIKLLRFASTRNESDVQNISLQNYIDKMDTKQKEIFYITADNYISAKNSPHLEIYNEKKIEVLLLYDRIDEWVINYLPKFNEKSFQAINKSNESLNKLLKKDKENTKETNEKFQPFIEKIKKILKDKVNKVKLTFYLKNTPVIVTTETNEITTQMAKLFESIGQSVPKVKYNFEINPEHKLIKKIINIKDEKLISKWIKMLFDQALFVEKGTLDNPNKFIERINNLLLK